MPKPSPQPTFEDPMTPTPEAVRYHRDQNILIGAWMIVLNRQAGNRPERLRQAAESLAMIRKLYREPTNST